jgi:hypothetical protein
VFHYVSWSSPEELTEFGLVLVRSGGFKRSVQGRESVVDPTVAYLEGRGQEQEIAHPASGDVCTAVSFPQEVFAYVWGGEARSSRTTGSCRAADRAGAPPGSTGCTT